jgi:TatD DNase family protein
MQLVDTHAHAHFKAFKDDSDAVINKSLNEGVVLNLVGTQSDTSKNAVLVAEKYENVFASIGLHPEHLFSKHVDEEETSFQSREEEFDYDFYKKLAEHPKTIGVGECGLDLYRIPEGMTAEQMLPKQKKVFLDHVRLAKEMNLPMVIHCREAHEHLIEILRSQEAVGIRGTIHCYTSNWAHAQQYLEMGFYIGFTGVITFPPLKANPQAQVDLLEVVRKMPLERLLLETDCPYLAPIPYRGKRCEPWMVKATAQKIADLRGISIEDVARVSTQNALTLFTKMAKIS